jgi:hypothetical protein
MNRPAAASVVCGLPPFIFPSPPPIDQGLGDRTALKKMDLTPPSRIGSPRVPDTSTASGGAAEDQRRSR